jgi:predicted Zn finger-like uncharacterized protein
MDITTNCPGCSAKVRVPDTLLGRSVKCPRCQTVFKAASPEEPEPGFEEVPEEEDERPRRRRRSVPVDEDDYEDRPPRARRGGSRRFAAGSVKGPAIALIVLGALGLVYAVINVVLNLVGGNDLVLARMGRAAGNQAAFQAGMQVGRIIGMLLPVIWGLVVTMAGFMMLNLRSYGSAMTGTIFAMLPCSPGCLLGLPFGIWGLVVLNRPDVKRSFQ